MTITDSAAGSPHTVPLTGTGFTPAAAIGLSVTSLTFGGQVVGTISNPQVVLVTNVGTATLTFSSIAVTGANTGDFGESNTCGASMAVGTGCTISVTFSPTAAGARSAAVTITDNAAGSTAHGDASRDWHHRPGHHPGHRRVFG